MTMAVLRRATADEVARDGMGCSTTSRAFSTTKYTSGSWSSVWGHWHRWAAEAPCNAVEQHLVPATHADVVKPPALLLLQSLDGQLAALKDVLDECQPVEMYSNSLLGATVSNRPVSTSAAAGSSSSSSSSP
jgi:hypothetical protein